MSLDGKLLARARERLAEVRAENEREQARRQERAYAAVPELKNIDARQRGTRAHRLLRGLVRAVPYARAHR